ncbi:ABC transporter ATP-binding protein [Limnochorda pilosa]|uniref:ATP-binding protein n=1 Tax=Limnochorda pilosa TaxID=1555112 RepID=A0A0K2SIY3_LIMPI|nr:ABC transporter ATP-binding protein [Limnochorda pilosa]BAS26789.1 ATP-binding protein [Limnochorda pilosa]
MIRVAGLAYRYPGSTRDALQGVDFSVEPGEIFGFLGPSGAGKSTTQKLVIGVLRDYRGTVEVMGRDLRHFGREYYRHVGVCFELPNLYTRFTAVENLDFFSKLYDKPTQDPLRLLRLVGLEGEAHTRVGEFSKGMKMRLNFCRALLHDPEILFLDEPTSGLDPTNGRRIMEIIREQKRQGKTVFLTTHNMTVADQLCDRVAFIVDGRISLIDAPRELKLRHGRRRVRVECRNNGSTVAWEFPLADIGENGDFMALLKAGTVETIHTQEATLEDVFVATTGRGLL